MLTNKISEKKMVKQEYDLVCIGTIICTKNYSSCQVQFFISF